jgi:hypothetical protein
VLALAQVKGEAARKRNIGALALVAELVDALVSGTSGRKAVGVRVPSRAPREEQRLRLNTDADDDRSTCRTQNRNRVCLERP